MSVNKTTVYTRPRCVQCNATFNQLNKLGVDYEVVTVDTAEISEALRVMGGYMQAPVVVHRPEGSDSDVHWGGYRPDLIDTYFKPVK